MYTIGWRKKLDSSEALEEEDAALEEGVEEVPGTSHQTPSLRWTVVGDTGESRTVSERVSVCVCEEIAYVQYFSSL